jgi:hypothetical protein
MKPRDLLVVTVALLLVTLGILLPTLIAMAMPAHGQTRIPGPGGLAVGGGGGGGPFSDTFAGTIVNTGKWTVHTAGSGTVSQNNGLTTTGDGNWGHAWIQSVPTWNRTSGDITISATITPLSGGCDGGEVGMGWGDGEVDGVGHSLILFTTFGTIYFHPYKDDAVPNGELVTVGGWSCADNTPADIQIVIHTDGSADLYINGAGMPNAHISSDASVVGTTHGVFFESNNGSMKVTSVTVSQ